MGNEKWKPVVGYELRYEVSNMGRIRSLTRGIMLKQWLQNCGYLEVSLFDGVKFKGHRVHRIVAIAWIPNPENKVHVNHKKGIKTDNRVSKLEWNTPSENNIHAFVIGSRGWSDKSRRKVSKSMGGRPFKAFKNGQLVGKFYTYSEAAKKLGIKWYEIPPRLKDNKVLPSGYKFIRA